MEQSTKATFSCENYDAEGLMKLLDLSKEQLRLRLNYSDEDADLVRSFLHSELGWTSEDNVAFTCQVISLIFLCVPPMIFLIGTVGNLLSFSVLCRRSMLYHPSYMYLAVLALVDEGVLCFGLLRRWTDRLAGHRLEERHWVLCKLLNYTGVTTSCLSAWIVVAVTVERALVIKLPLHSAQSDRVKRSRVVLLCMTLAVFLIGSHFFVTIDLVDTTSIIRDDYFAQNDTFLVNGSVTLAKLTAKEMIASYHIQPAQICDFREPFSTNGVKRAWVSIDAAIYSYIPFLLITVFNIIILTSLRTANKNRSALLVNSTHAAPASVNPRNTPSVMHQGWKSLTNFCSFRERPVAATPRKVCTFCAQSFPIDRFHVPRGPNEIQRWLPVNCCETHKSDAPSVLRHDSWRALPPQRPVNITFLPYRINGIAVKTVNITRKHGYSMATEMRQLTILLLLMSATFLVTTSPVGLVKGMITWNSMTSVGLEWMDCIAELLMYTNHAANFYLYIAVGSRFRKELRGLFSCRQRKKQRQYLMN
ncbi:hypothetical protein CRM22_004706 [Opisthorchis felineus]|uniref:G-protein coupled receptors family 1 profile domain-containing protein n=1 Tax=Opisthorchis felineus TaxID=147828 RepID=A0A4S2LUY8_OPIFE|nr:hypothetical protein CRM22_004706 [Opisthorchis felineus]TGZ67644.1 hypothetical protein CRM22_004706 [Opisthorchis felineus]